MPRNPTRHNIFTLGARHPRPVAWLRVAIGIWLVVLTAILDSAGHGGDWVWLLVLVAVLHFGLALRLFRTAHRQRETPVRFQ